MCEYVFVFTHHFINGSNLDDFRFASLSMHDKTLPKWGLPYFFSYDRFFSFQNSPKNLDPSYKMDLDLWDCLGMVKLVL